MLFKFFQHILTFLGGTIQDTKIMPSGAFISLNTCLDVILKPELLVVYMFCT